MNIQLALDRMTIPEAVAMARSVQDCVDWIEVGTSLIKEFGMDSVKAIKREFPDKVVVADMKTFDNAKYEFELCYQAGADVATVMGAAPLVTVETCMDTAARLGKTAMIDLLHTSPEQQASLFRYRDAVPCLHVSKDEQEQTGYTLHGGGSARGLTAVTDGTGLSAAGGLTALTDGIKLAVAGGITLQSLPSLLAMKPFVIIIGSAITKAEDPRRAAFDIKQVLNEHKESRNYG